MISNNNYIIYINPYSYHNYINFIKIRRFNKSVSGQRGHQKYTTHLPEKAKKSYFRSDLTEYIVNIDQDY